MIESALMRYVVVGVLIVAIWLLIELWIQPGEKVRQTVRILGGAALVIVAIRLFLWFIGVW